MSEGVRKDLGVSKGWSDEWMLLHHSAVEDDDPHQILGRALSDFQIGHTGLEEFNLLEGWPCRTVNLFDLGHFQELRQRCSVQSGAGDTD